jgi:hypothetical protein
MVFVEATNQEVKDVVLREMIGRILKDEIEERKRSEMKQQKGIPLQEPFGSVIVDVFNQLLNKDKGLFKAIQEKIKEKYHIEIGVRLLDNSLPPFLCHFKGCAEPKKSKLFPFFFAVALELNLFLQTSLP